MSEENESRPPEAFVLGAVTIWGEPPRWARSYFGVRKRRKTFGCTDETCPHLDHDPVAHYYTLRPKPGVKVLWEGRRFLNHVVEHYYKVIEETTGNTKFLVIASTPLLPRWDRLYFVTNVPWDELI